MNHFSSPFTYHFNIKYFILPMFYENLISFGITVCIWAVIIFLIISMCMQIGQLWAGVICAHACGGCGLFSIQRLLTVVVWHVAAVERPGMAYRHFYTTGEFNPYFVSQGLSPYTCLCGTIFTVYDLRCLLLFSVTSNGLRFTKF